MDTDDPYLSSSRCRLGILSDTHGNAAAMSYAVLALRQRGAGFIVHCGDVGPPRMLDLLAGGAAGFVWGNADAEREGLERRAQELGITCFCDFEQIKVLGLRIAVLHGQFEEVLSRHLRKQRYDYVLHGHSHVWRDEQIGRTRVINPGALSRAAELTCALLHLPEGRLEKIRLS